MKTRTSWRNQDKLWKSLGGQQKKIEPIISKVCGNCACYKGQRNKGQCSQINALTYSFMTCEKFN
jgi:hypothetical protein